jgi:hypothetical protein
MRGGNDNSIRVSPSSEVPGAGGNPGPIRAGHYSFRPVQAPNLRETLEPELESRYVLDIDMTLTSQYYFGNYVSELVTAPVGFLINYLQISPSARGNDVLVSIDSSIQWREVVVETGANEFVPLADYLVSGGDSTQEYMIPARKSVTIYACIVLPPQTNVTTFPYRDFFRIIVGYRRAGGFEPR